MDSLKLELKKLMIDALDLEGMTPGDIPDDAPLFATDGVGLDSIDALEIGIILQTHYGLTLAANDANTREHFRSVDTLAAFIASQQAARKQTQATGAQA